MNVPISPLLATLLERLEGREALDFELKAARNGLPKDLWETVSAFANTSGGWMVLGVEHVEGTPTVSGVRNASEQLKTFYDLIRNPQKISHPACGADDSSVEILGDKELIVLRIPAAPRQARPVFINGNPYAGTFVRRHAADYRCNKAEVDRMMREASDIASDSAILAHFDWSDLDREALARYRRLHQNLQPASPWNSYEDQRFLQAIGGFRRDRETGAEGITVAGLLLVGSPEAIREWRGRHLIDYRLVPGDADSDTRWDDRIAWEGNLFGAFETIYPRLTDGLRVPFRLEGGRRIDESYVHVALREALVNLLVHADYGESQASLIKRSPEGYLFRNPGSSRVSEIDLLTGDRSDPRNPALVRMFRLIGLAEEAGTGMPKIIRAWRNLGFRLPAIDVGTERYEFTLLLRHVHLLSEEDRTWLRTLGEGWTEAEQLALLMARHEGEVDNPRLRSLTGEHPADTTKVLGSLRDRGLLQMSGVGRGARYQLAPVATSELGPLFGLADAAMRSEQPIVPSGEGANVSEGVGVSPGGMGTSSEGTGDSYGDIGISSGGMGTSSGDLWGRLQEISKASRAQRRLKPAQRDEIIVGLCTLVPLSLSELAGLLDRSEDHVREALQHLLSSGRIAFLYPERPSHPQQKYIARPRPPIP